MDSVKVAQDKQTVLLTSEGLTQAALATTKDGKKRLDGIYLPNGNRVEQSSVGARAEEAAIANEEAQQAININKVAKTYQTKQHIRHRKADKQKKTEEEYDDAESAKKAEKILAGVSEHEKLQFQELFNFFDVDKDRTWGSIEFAQRMTDIGCNTSVESASNLLYFAGVRDVDRITYDDFVQLMPKLKAFRRLLEKDAMKSFQAKDPYGRGYISLVGLRQVLEEIAGRDGISERQLEAIVRQADRERTGMITFEFFIRALFGTPPLMPYVPKKRGISIFGWLCGSAYGDDFDDDFAATRY